MLSVAGASGWKGLGVTYLFFIYQSVALLFCWNTITHSQLPSNNNFTTWTTLMSEIMTVLSTRTLTCFFWRQQLSWFRRHSRLTHFQISLEWVCLTRYLTVWRDRCDCDWIFLVLFVYAKSKSAELPPSLKFAVQYLFFTKAYKEGYSFFLSRLFVCGCLDNW